MSLYSTTYYILTITRKFGELEKGYCNARSSIEIFSTQSNLYRYLAAELYIPQSNYKNCINEAIRKPALINDDHRIPDFIDPKEEEIYGVLLLLDSKFRDDFVWDVLNNGKGEYDRTRFIYNRQLNVTDENLAKSTFRKGIECIYKNRFGGGCDTNNTSHFTIEEFNPNTHEEWFHTDTCINSGNTTCIRCPFPEESNKRQKT